MKAQQVGKGGKSCYQLMAPSEEALNCCFSTSSSVQTTGWLDLFGKKEVEAKGVFNIQCELHPYRLKPNTNDFVDLEIDLQNTSGTEAMTSVVVSVSKGIGVDRSAISQQREIRLGYLKPGERKHVKAQVWGTQRTEKGVYAIEVHAISHFHDYAHILNRALKRLALRVE